jgi:HSP20 family protein
MAQSIDAEHNPSEVRAVREDLIVPAFKPPLDVIATEDAVLLEVVLPGVERPDVTVERVGRMLLIHGLRRDEHTKKGSSYHYVETPRGPFLRTIPIPFELDADPPVELERGVLRIRLAVPKEEASTKLSDNTENQGQHNDGERG